MAHGSGRVTPTGLNAAVAILFTVGSACFVVGSVPAYADAVGGAADGATFFVGSLFFTTASAAQLLQAQSPALATPSADTQHTPAPVHWLAWRPHDRSWLAAATQLPGTLFFNISTFAALAHNLTTSQEDRHVWRPDIFGSTLFLVSSTYAVLAVSGSARTGDRLPARIAYVNLLGSVLFMASALASFVLADGSEVDEAVAVAGTLLGAACFLIGAILMLPAWQQAVRRTTPQGERT